MVYPWYIPMESVLEPTPVPQEIPAAALTPAPLQEPPAPAPEIPAPQGMLAPGIPAPVKSLEITDVLYNKIILNAPLLTTIHRLKTKGFNNSDIPVLILTILGTYNSHTTARSKALTVDDIQTLLERVYVYFVEKYNLIDEDLRLAMYTLFDSSLQLCLATPNVKKEVTSCLRFFRC